MKNLFKRGLALLVSATILLSLLYTGTVMTVVAAGGGDSPETTAPVYSGAKTATWTSKETMDIDISCLFDGTKNVAGGTVLFMGTRCKAHGMASDTIQKSINSMAQYANVKYHALVKGTSSSTSDKSGTIKKGSKMTSAPSLDNTQHYAETKFAKTLYDELVPLDAKGKPILATADGAKVKNDYGLIVLEFDASGIEYDGQYGSGSYKNITVGTKTSDLNATKLEALKSWLDKYYAEGRVVWVTPATGSAYNFGYSPYTSRTEEEIKNEKSKASGYTGDFNYYCLNGYGYTCPNQQDYGNADKLANYLSAYVANYYGKTTFDDVVADGLTITDVIPQFKNKTTGEWVSFTKGATGTVTDGGVQKQKTEYTSVDDVYGKTLKATALVWGQNVNVVFDVSAAENAARDAGKWWGHDLRVKIQCNAKEFVEKFDEETTELYTNVGDATIVYSDPPKNESGKAETYEITLRLEEEPPKVTVPPHFHGLWEYSADGDDLTATCKEEDCTVEGGYKTTITISAEDGIYGSQENFPATIENADEWAANKLEVPTIHYTGIDGTTYDSDSPPTEVGKYKATITKDGKTASTTYEVKPGTATIEDIEDKTYTGSPIEPDPVVKCGTKVLTEGVDYDVVISDDYTNNVNAGEDTAKVTVHLKGNYAGDITKNFTILPKQLTAAAIQDIADQTYTGTGLEPDPVVKDGAKTLTEGTDYEVVASTDYTDNVNVSEDTAKVTVHLKGNYTGDISKTFDIVPEEPTPAKIQPIEDQVYTGSPIEPTPVVKDGDKVLVEGVDYEVVASTDYSDNVDVSEDTAKVVVHLKGNYKGDIEQTFDIIPKEPTTAAIQPIADQVYTGEAIEPVLLVKDGDTVLVEGRDYEKVVSGDFSDNINVGENTASVVVHLKGNYKGDIEQTFSIIPKVPTTAQIQTIEDQVYTGEAIEPDPVVKDGLKTLVEGQDYEVVVSTDYTDNVNVGENTAKVTVHLKGNYAGDIYRNFSIIPEEPTPAKIQPIEAQEYTGEAIEPTPVVKDGDKVLVEGVDYEVVESTDYSDNIDVSKDTAKVVVHLKGNYKGDIEQTFDIIPKEPTPAAIQDIADQVYTGEAIEPAPVVKDGDKTLVEGKDYEIVTSGDYSDNVDVSEDTAKVVVHLKGNYKGDLEKTFNIIPEEPTPAAIQPIADQVYTGEAIEPTPIVKDGDKVLIEGVDYEIVTTTDYSDNIDVSEDTAKVVVHLKGNYKGDIEQTFNIVPKVPTPAAIQPIEDQEYTGEAIEPAPVVKDGSKVLVEGVDYEIVESIDYTNNINVGEDTAKVIVHLKGNYKGDLEQTFSIIPKEPTPAAIQDIADQVYTGEAIEPAPVVKDGDKTLVEGVDYEIVASTDYSDNIDVSEDTAKVVVHLKGNYKGDLEKTFNIIPEEPTPAAIQPIEDQVYTGEAIEPTPVVKDGDKVLVEGVDYDVVVSADYSDNVDVSEDTAKVVVHLKGNYKGDIEKTFNIIPEEPTPAAIQPIEDQVYTGEAIEPAPVVKDGDKVLVEGVDYEIVTSTDYSDNVNVSQDTAKVVVHLKGNYKGDLEKTFNIIPKEPTPAAIQPIPDQVYTGSELEPSPVVKDGDKVLVEGVDYDVVVSADYSDNIDVSEDTAKVVIHLKGNYKGDIEKTFNIIPKEPTPAAIQPIEDQVYTGEAIEPAPVVKDGDKVLVEGVDYEIVASTDYSDNVDVSEDTAKVVVHLKGNYKGDIEKTFNIIPEEPTPAAIQPISDQVYTGSPLEPAPIVKDGDKVLVEGVDYDVVVSTDYSDNVDVSEDTAKVVVHLKGNYKGDLEKTFNIIPKVPTPAAIQPIEDQVYTGEALEPAPVVKDGDKVLVEGVDYEVVTSGDYSDNVDVSEDTAKVVVHLKGNYKGDIEKTFNIIPKEPTPAAIQPIEDQVYTGTAIEPAPVVKDGDKTLVEGKDYEIVTSGDYSDNIDVSQDTAKVVVHLKGNYKGDIEKTFNIIPKVPTPAAIQPIPDQFYTGSAIEPAPVVKDGDKTLVEGKDYEVVTSGDYSDNIDVSQDTAKVVVHLKGNYKGDLEKTFNIIPKVPTPATVEPIPAQTYTGKEIKPTPVVKDGDKTLVEGKDYEIKEYINNVDTGTATVVIELKGNYTGTLQPTFVIESKPLNETNIKPIPEQTYTGKELTPKPEIYDGEKKLVEGKDYEITKYEENIDVGTATVFVEYKGNYKGTGEKDFDIIPKDDLTNENIKPIPEQYYTGKEITPKPEIYDGDKKLVEGVDYEIKEYKDNIETGTATVVVELMGNYKGTLEAKFEIKPKEDLSDINIDDIPDQHCVKPEPPVTIIYDGKELKLGEDYDVEYIDNEEAGVATAKITFKGNYTGSVEKKFNITHKPRKEDGKLPDINIPGWKEYYICDCGDMFEDENCTIAIKNIDEWKQGRGLIPPLQSPKTGEKESVDLFNMLLSIAFVGFASFGAAAAFLAKKKEDNEEQ